MDHAFPHGGYIFLVLNAFEIGFVDLLSLGEGGGIIIIIIIMRTKSKMVYY